MARMTAAELCADAPVIPVLVVDDAAQAVPLARALVAGGLRVLEITLRTPAALDAIGRIARDVPDAIVGAGSVLRPEHLDSVDSAGGRFAVAPGTTPSLLAAADRTGMPLLPGAQTASEVMALLDSGLEVMKFFPAGPAGGPATLRALGGPLPAARFCPTGGVSAGNAADYLALDNVLCVGGSWVAPSELVAAGDWPSIERLAGAAAAL